MSKKELALIVNEMKKKNHRVFKIKKMLKDLSKKDFNFNQKYYVGKTLLHYTIENNITSLIKPLINYGCNVNVCDDNYVAPLHLAIKQNNIKAIKKLIKCGADLDITTEFEQTPLHLATIMGSMHIVKLLITSGADYTIVDEKNLSILDYAKDENNLKIIEYLKKNCLKKEGKH